LPNSVIVNIDSTRIIKNIFPYKNIVDFYELKKAENIDLEDYIVSLIEKSPFENIIIDTKGGLSEDLKLILKYVTAIVVPVKVGDLSEEASYEFIFAIKNYLDTIGRKVNWAIVYNEISPKFLKKIGVKKYDFVDLIKDSIDFLKEEILKDDLKVVTYLKRSESITTREIVKKDIDDLLKENFTAYLPIKEEVERLNKDLKVIL
jgi:cellulose biosynthesis protein BcsQ